MQVSARLQAPTGPRPAALARAFPPRRWVRGGTQNRAPRVARAAGAFELAKRRSAAQPAQARALDRLDAAVPVRGDLLLR